MNTAALPFIPAKPRRHRKRAAVSAASPPPVALTLVSVTENGRESIDLTFDRAINVAGLDASAFVVEDGNDEHEYTGSGSPTQLSPAAVRIFIAVSGDSEEAGVHLTASADNGIVAVDDGGTWAGVSDLAVPYP